MKERAWENSCCHCGRHTTLNDWSDCTSTGPTRRCLVCQTNRRRQRKDLPNCFSRTTEERLQSAREKARTEAVDQFRPGAPMSTYYVLYRCDKCWRIYGLEIGGKPPKWWQCECKGWIR